MVFRRGCRRSMTVGIPSDPGRLGEINLSGKDCGLKG